MVVLFFYTMENENKDKINEVGRPTKYDPSVHDDWAEDLFSRGFTIAHVAFEFGVTSRTIDNWIANNESFREKVQEGKARNVGDIAQSLRNQALGFYKMVKEPKVVGGELVYAEYLKYFPPNGNTAQYYIGTLDPKNWRNKDNDETEESTKPVAINIKVVKNDD